MIVLEQWDRNQLAGCIGEVLEVYAEAMEVQPSAARGRRTVMRDHLDRDGLRSVAAVDGPRLVGIGYGYVGGPGQWWHDHVRKALLPEQAAAWLDGAFEVCELHVRPALQGTGVGRAVLEQLLGSTPAATSVLTTPDTDTRARRFYRSGGWLDLVHGLVFPGDPRSFAVLGRHLGSAP